MAESIMVNRCTKAKQEGTCKDDARHGKDGAHGQSSAGDVCRMQCKGEMKSRRSKPVSGVLDSAVAR